MEGFNRSEEAKTVAFLAWLAGHQDALESAIVDGRIALSRSRRPLTRTNGYKANLGSPKEGKEAMTDLGKVLDRYAAAWTENDPARQRELIADLYAPQAYYANQGNDYRGTDGVEVAVVRNWERFISKGFTFEVVDGAAAHHGAVRVPWRMLTPDGTTVAAAGMQVLVLDDTDRVTTDYQFITQAPPA